MERWQRSGAVLAFVALAAYGCIQAEDLAFLRSDDDVDPAAPPSAPSDDAPATDAPGGSDAPPAARSDDTPDTDIPTADAWSRLVDVPPRSGEYLVEAGDVEVQSDGDIEITSAAFAATEMFPGLGLAQDLIFAVEVRNVADDLLAESVLVHVSGYAPDGRLVAFGMSHIASVDPEATAVVTGWIGRGGDDVTMLRVQTRADGMVGWLDIPGGLEVTDVSTSPDAPHDPDGDLEVRYRSTYGAHTGVVSIHASGFDEAGELVAIAAGSAFDGLAAGADATQRLYPVGDLAAVERWTASATTDPRDLGQ